MDLQILDGAQMTEALVWGEILQVYMILQDRVLISIVNNNGEDMIIKGHKQDRVFNNIVNSTGEDMIIESHKQDSVLISSKQVTAVISDKVDAIYSCDEPVSHLGSKQVMFVTSNTVHSCSKLAGRPREVMVMRMRTSTTTLGWRLAAATSTNRSLLFLVGEGHHW
jgi:hypothetical protein